MEHLRKNVQNELGARYSDSGRYFRGDFSADAVARVEKLRMAFGGEKVSFKRYQPRSEQRYRFIADVFVPHLAGTILDVGTRAPVLENILGRSVAIVDKNNPALPPFDWEKEKLPYADNSFDTVVCLDVLEHINDLHGAFHDLLRVARTNIIVSLPNCWRKTYKYMLVRGRGSRPSYGLPPERPTDRHKWFFTTEDIEDFFYYQSAAAPYPYSVADIRYHLPVETRLQSLAYPILLRALSPSRFKNTLVNTVFVVLQKRAK